MHLRPGALPGPGDLRRSGELSVACKLLPPGDVLLAPCRPTCPCELLFELCDLVFAGSSDLLKPSGELPFTRGLPNPTEICAPPFCELFGLRPRELLLPCTTSLSSAPWPHSDSTPLGVRCTRTCDGTVETTSDGGLKSFESDSGKDLSTVCTVLGISWSGDQIVAPTSFESGYSPLRLAPLPTDSVREPCDVSVDSSASSNLHVDAVGVLGLELPASGFPCG